MRSTSAMGTPREYLNPQRQSQLSAKWAVDTHDLNAYIAGLRKHTSTTNGVVAIKLMVRHLELMHTSGQLKRATGRLGELAKYFGDVVAIKLLRRDKLRQAISLTKAQQTGRWGVLKKATAKAQYDREAIEQNIIAIIKHESQWEREFSTSNMHAAMTLYYEDLPTAREEVLLKIATLLELPDAQRIINDRERGDVQLQRQADEETELWYDQFVGGTRPEHSVI